MADPRVIPTYVEMADSNYVGELFVVGQTATPFLNEIGGIGGANAKITQSFEFPITQEVALNAGSQPEITEDASVAGIAKSKYTRSQTSNTVQIFQEAVEVSYAKQSTYNLISGLNVGGTNPVRDEMAFQKQMILRQIAKNVEYTMINGVYQKATDNITAAKTRGIIAAITTNEISALDENDDATALTKELVEDLLAEMAVNGAVFENPVILVNAFQKMALTKLYTVLPTDRRVGGSNILTIETDFTRLGIMYVPQMPADTLVVADLAHIAPVFCPVPGKGLLFYEDLAKVGASVSGQFYGQIGLDYGPEIYHGKITGLTTSRTAPVVVEPVVEPEVDPEVTP